VEAVLIGLIVCLVSGAITAVIAVERRLSGPWFVVGFLFPIIGLLLVMVMQPTQSVHAEAEGDTATEKPVRPCPWCEASISRTARVCRFCARDVVEGDAIAQGEQDNTAIETIVRSIEPDGEANMNDAVNVDGVCKVCLSELPASKDGRRHQIRCPECGNWSTIG
jgi:hypothetical protein